MGKKHHTADGFDGANDGNVASEELRAFIERIERLEEEKKAIADDIKDVLGEAASRGYDKKTIRKIIAIRKKDAQQVAEEEAILDVYMAALGMIPGRETAYDDGDDV